MAKRIPNDVIQDIRHQVSIVDIILDYVDLEKRGQNYLGLCPFHDERTPSFTVSEQKGIYHCFGCHAGGDVFNFVQNIDGLHFTESVEKVAQLGQAKVAFEFNQVDRELSPEEQRRQALIKINEDARKVYHHFFMNVEAGRQAYEYMASRLYTDETLVTFQIGYAPKQKDALSLVLTDVSYAYSEQDLVAAGLATMTERGLVDRFHDRLMIPLRNAYGQTIGFSGRALDNDPSADPGPKYLNTSETEIFSKRHFLFNYDLAKDTIRKNKKVVIYEGFMDVMSAYQAGAQNGVASSGTNLTDDQVKLLTRTKADIMIAYDGDNAGQAATAKALQKLQNYPDDKIQVLPAIDRLDPDEFIKKFGAEKFLQHLANNGKSIYSFYMDFYANSYDLNHDTEKLRYVEIIMTKLQAVDSPVAIEIYLKELAERTNLSKDSLLAQYQETKPQRSQAPLREVGASQTWEAVPEDTFDQTRQFSQTESAERILLHRLMSTEKCWQYLEMTQEELEFRHEDYQFIYIFLKEMVNRYGLPIDISTLLAYIEDVKISQLIVEIQMMDLDPDFTQQEFDDLLYQIRDRATLKEQKQDLENQLAQAESLGDQQTMITIINQLIIINKKINKGGD